MKLFYYKGANFGDAINPIVFEKLLPNFFDGNSDELFVGIGSILGWVNPDKDCKRIIIFSSGFADGDETTYGKSPKLDERYEVLCVRGQLTAKKLGIPVDKAISDGALLLPVLFPYQNVTKKYEFSYMPHVGSLDVYDGWKELCESCGIHLIDPKNNPFEVIQEMTETKILLTEAMHGAIVADAYRIPWIPVKTIKTINDFKWRDYLGTVGLAFYPNNLKTLYSRIFLNGIFKAKLAKLKLGFLAPIPSTIYYFYQSVFVVRNVKRNLERVKKCKTFLCSEEILKQRQSQLSEKIEEFKKGV